MHFSQQKLHLWKQPAHHPNNHQSFKLIGSDQESTSDSGLFLSCPQSSENKSLDYSCCISDNQSDKVNAFSSKHTNMCYKFDNTFSNYKDLSNHSQQQHKNLSFSCHICDKTFTHIKDLSHHLETDHLSELSFTCEECGHSFSHKSVHKSKHPISPAPILVYLTCYKCDKSFEQFSDLSDHILTQHDASQFYPCDECELAFPTMILLDSHVEMEHKHLIAQCDGPTQEVFDFTNVSPPETVRTANYSLNKNKQMNEIHKDASINDFEVTVNNFDQNATIKCSSGFYTQVALPSFATLAKRSVFSKSKVAITVDEVTITQDKSGLESNRLMYFSFVTEQKSIGGATVHLHHSTRTIQIQGSHVMPDASRAAAWFANNVTVTRFKEQAKAKKYAIKAFNEAAKKLSSSNISANLQQSANCCQSCHSTFNTKSKPSRCDLCSKYFHKTNCLKDHSKICLSSSQTVPISLPSHSSTILASTSSSTTIAPTTSSPSSFTNCIVTSSPFTSSTTLLSSSLSLISGLQTSITFVPSSTTPLPVPPNVLPSSSALRSITAPISSVPPQNKTKSKRQTTKKSPLPTSPDEIKIEFLQTELAAAQTRIVILDASLKDKEQVAPLTPFQHALTTILVSSREVKHLLFLNRK